MTNSHSKRGLNFYPGNEKNSPSGDEFSHRPEKTDGLTSSTWGHEIPLVDLTEAERMVLLYRANGMRGLRDCPPMQCEITLAGPTCEIAFPSAGLRHSFTVCATD